MKTLTVGIGCRLHSSAEEIETAVRATLGSHPFDEISTIASVDVKAQEAGLLEFCARHALPLKLFSREQIAAISVDDPSAAAREHLGIDGVCEPCALLAAAAESGAAHASIGSITPIASFAADTPNARLLVRKTVHAGVTVAIASTTARRACEQTNDDTQEQDLP
ncbi:cobalamin biosynthesis protein [Paraburkholderia madseniana]|uniref:Cobalamin biosynthesis protein n=2 Tax=Paraburkholderia madseniana TaxID=2599607 RepID=A0AAP5BGD5_9BURK|nr:MULTISPECIES: cobalamin biosynthesis protein [Paraburkholderia]MCX4147782.1 cobalamin biosynthesis protein [Paraburkholderia madseniana]MDN7150724.1 cobalamin biosynthesis protein [Paraburkholderia sp. WS6]MDQ6409604.1 cobalamin biosynthesis protein [Paraburkholderia madseniana]